MSGSAERLSANGDVDGLSNADRNGQRSQFFVKSDQHSWLERSSQRVQQVVGLAQNDCKMIQSYTTELQLGRSTELTVFDIQTGNQRAQESGNGYGIHQLAIAVIRLQR